jgi:hypothetical protein
MEVSWKLEAKRGTILPMFSAFAVLDQNAISVVAVQYIHSFAIVVRTPNQLSA